MPRHDGLVGDGGCMKEQQGRPVGLRIKIDTLIILLISLTPFNLSVVDKAGLDGNLDNSLDKMMRVAWFFVALVAVVLLKPGVIFGGVRVGGVILKSLLIYVFVLLVGLVINGVGVVGYYRLLEYSLLICGLVIVGKVVVQEGREEAIRVFSRWVNMVSWWTLLIIVIGLFVSAEHFYALETQGRYRLGGNAYSPNFLGMVFALGVLSGLYLTGEKRSGACRPLIVLGCFLFLLALYLTGSRTAQFSLVMALGWWWYVKRAQISRLMLFLAVAFFVLPILLVFLQSWMSWLLPLIGKGESPVYDLLTLNNRSVVAEVGLRGALEHWGAGVGFVEGVKDYYKNNFTQSYWLPPHSHNALVEVFLSGGVVALLLMMISFLSVLGLVLRTTLRSRAGEDVVLAAMAIPLLLGCVTMTIFGGVYTVLTFWFFSLAVFAWVRR